MPTPVYQTAVVLVANGKPDADGDVFTPGDVTFPDGWLPVSLGFKQTEIIGRAMLHWDGPNLVADLELQQELPGLYASVGGVRTGRKFEILGVGVTGKGR